MTMVKKAAINSDSSGRIMLSRTRNSTLTKAKTVARKSVAALYPLAPTTISEKELDEAIINAIDKRLKDKK